jgi:hypothetical protein
VIVAEIPPALARGFSRISSTFFCAAGVDGLRGRAMDGFSLRFKRETNDAQN